MKTILKILTYTATHVVVVLAGLITGMALLSPGYYAYDHVFVQQEGDPAVLISAGCDHVLKKQTNQVKTYACLASGTSVDVIFDPSEWLAIGGGEVLPAVSSSFGFYWQAKSECQAYLQKRRLLFVCGDPQQDKGNHQWQRSQITPSQSSLPETNGRQSA